MVDGAVSEMDSEYFLVLEARDERLPSVMPDEDTASKPYSFRQLPPFGKPLILVNGASARQKRRGVVPYDPPPEILFDGSDLIVKGGLREKLLSQRVDGLTMQPAIYIDDGGRWHEDYWFLAFLGVLDCWDRKTSSFEPDPSPNLDGSLAHEVYRYSLDEPVLRGLPLSSRLLFKMGGTTEEPVVAHATIADYFRVLGADVVALSNYDSAGA